MAVAIRSTLNVSADGVKCVIYGASGIGKTRLALTAPKPIIISAERGLLSLSQHDIPAIEVQSVEDVQGAFNLSTKGDYQTIILDSLSEISETVLSKLKKDSKDARQAYGVMAESLGNLIRNFRDLVGKHVVFIAKMRRVEDEDSGVVSFEPYLPGKILPFQLPYLVDEVFVMRMNPKKERFLQTESDLKHIAKDRSGLLSANEPPDLGLIFNKIMKVK